jgi:nicotinamidase-related amidase
MMALTTLDRVTALIVIDLQKGIAIPPTVTPIEEVVANAINLAAEFRSFGLPVVLVNVAGGAPGRSEQPAPATRPEGWTELLPELGRHDEDLTVTKKTWGAFTGTGLDGLLRQRGVTNVVLAGIATSMGVESTARQAHELGYNVTVALDAVTDRNLETHRNSTERIFPRLAETAVTSEIISTLRASRGS